MRAGVWHLSRPLVQAVRNRWGRGGAGRVQALKAGVLLTAIWGILVLLCARFVAQVSLYPEIREALITRILALSLGAAGSLTVVATTIAALSTLFLSSDLRLWLIAPLDWLDRFRGQFVRVLVTGGWAVLVVFTPVLAAVGRVAGWPWGYLVTSAVGLGAVLVGATALGILLALVLAHLGGAGRARTGFGLVVGAVVAGTWWVIHHGGYGRQLLDAGQGSALAMVGLLASPAMSPWPTEWLARALVQCTVGGGVDPLALGALTGASLLAALAAAGGYRLGYRRTLERARGGIDEPRPAGPPGRGRELLERRLGPARTALLTKDLMRIVRSSGDWAHWILPGAGYLLYVSNLSAVRLAPGDPRARLFSMLVAVASLGVGALVLASLAVHTVLPSVSLEGPGLPLLRSAPLARGALVRTKFAWGAGVFVPLAMLLSTGAAHVLGLGTAWTLLSALLSATLGSAFVGLALWFGARYPVYTARSTSEAGSLGTGGFMLTAVLLALVALACCAPLALSLLAGPEDLVTPWLSRLTAPGRAALFLVGVLGPLVVGLRCLRSAADLTMHDGPRAGRPGSGPPGV